MSNPGGAHARSIFVSHSSHDNHFCRRLVADLARCGFHLWYDEYDLHDGLIASRLNSAIERHDAFVCVWSAHAAQSRWVEREVNMAMTRNEQDLMEIYPVTVNGASLPAVLKMFKYFPFDAQNYQETLFLLSRALGHHGQVVTLSPSSDNENIKHLLHEPPSLDVSERMRLLQRIEGSAAHLTPGQLIDLQQVMFGDSDRAVRRAAAVVLRAAHG